VLLGGLQDRGEGARKKKVENQGHTEGARTWVKRGGKNRGGGGRRKKINQPRAVEKGLNQAPVQKKKKKKNHRGRKTTPQNEKRGGEGGAK